jgi:hypothetical protein
MERKRPASTSASGASKTKMPALEPTPSMENADGGLPAPKSIPHKVVLEPKCGWEVPVEWHELVTVCSYFFAFLPIVETAFMEQNILQETFGKQRDYLKSHPTFRYCDLCEVWGMHSSFMSAIFKACKGTGFRATYFQIYPFGSGCTKHRDDSQKLILKVDGVLRFWDGSQVSLQEINCTGTIGLIDTIGGGGALTGYTARPAHPNEDHDDDDDGNNISLEPNHILHDNYTKDDNPSSSIVFVPVFGNILNRQALISNLLQVLTKWTNGKLVKRLIEALLLYYDDKHADCGKKELVRHAMQPMDADFVGGDRTDSNRVPISIPTESQMESLKEQYPAVRTLLSEQRDDLRDFSPKSMPDDKTWLENLALVGKHIEETCGCTILVDQYLNKWATTQRTEFKLFLKNSTLSSLTEDRISRLQGIGFVWDPDDKTWLENLALVGKHIEETCGCTTLVDQYLNSWAHKQRTEFKLFLKNSTLSSLTEDRISRLQGIGFVWDPLEEYWRIRFEELKAFKKTNKHFVVDIAINKPLYDWKRKQKREKKNGKLSASRSRALDDIGFL